MLECSIASAERPNKCRQSGPCRNCRSARIRVGRGVEIEPEGEVEEEVEEEVVELERSRDVVLLGVGSRWRRRGRSRRPRG